MGIVDEDFLGSHRLLKDSTLVTTTKTAGPIVTTSKIVTTTTKKSLPVIS